MSVCTHECPAVGHGKNMWQPLFCMIFYHRATGCLSQGIHGCLLHMGDLQALRLPSLALDLLRIFFFKKKKKKEIFRSGLPCKVHL